MKILAGSASHELLLPLLLSLGASGFFLLNLLQTVEDAIVLLLVHAPNLFLLHFAQLEQPGFQPHPLLLVFDRNNLHLFHDVVQVRNLLLQRQLFFSELPLQIPANLAQFLNAALQRKILVLQELHLLAQRHLFQGMRLC